LLKSKKDLPSNKELLKAGFTALPPIIVASGEVSARKFLEFFAARIRNKNTRQAYIQATLQFLLWCEDRGIPSLHAIESITVAAYIEKHSGSPPTVKQHLAAIRKLFDWLVIGQAIRQNPATSVRGPKHVVKRGKTPVLSAEQTRQLLESIETSTAIGLRDRALIGIMVYSFGRVSAVTAMKVEDYFQSGKRWWFRVHEKGGKRHEIPAHHKAEQYLDDYLKVAGLDHEKKAPIFRTVDKRGQLTARAMNRTDALKMIKRRAKAAGLPYTTCCHTFRATGITTYLENGGVIEKAQAIAAHESPRTTKLYDRTKDDITLDEIERIVI